MRVRGLGPVPCDVMLIGEAPGAVEEATGKPFAGKSGRELTRYLRQAGLNRREIYVTNVVKERPTTRAKGGNVKPTVKDIRRDEPELVEEIERVRPTFIGAVGAVAARWLLGPVSIEESEGFPFATCNWRAARDLKDSANLVSVAHYTVIVIRHPASGLHSPEAQPLIYWDVMQFGKYVHGTLPLTTPRDLHPDPDYYEPRGAVKLVAGLPVAIDTEGLAGRVWGLSFSQFAGSAGVVRATNRRALQSIKEQVMG